MFKQAKWIINDVIGSEGAFKYDYKEHRKVINFDKDGNKVEREITLPTVIHQTIVKSIQTDISNLHKAKEKGYSKSINHSQWIKHLIVIKFQIITHTYLLFFFIFDIIA